MRHRALAAIEAKPAGHTEVGYRSSTQNDPRAEWIRQSWEARASDDNDYGRMAELAHALLAEPEGFPRQGDLPEVSAPLAQAQKLLEASKQTRADMTSLLELSEAVSRPEVAAGKDAPPPPSM